nr:MAG TPA: hypothetical protein [Caudoviricetes sp.]
MAYFNDFKAKKTLLRQMIENLSRVSSTIIKQQKRIPLGV